MHPGSGPMRRMSRRDFLRSSAGAAVTLPGAAAILAACTKPGQSTRTSIEEQLLANPARPDHPATLPLYQDPIAAGWRSEEHTSELQSHHDLVCRLLLEKKN